jgi:glycosyltransferase involved in cell wall biosynthesis
VILNHYAGSPEHGMEYRPYYMARQWRKLGHEVTIVAASESHLRSKRVDVKSGLTEQSIDGIRYVWLRTPKYQGNGARRVLNMATFVVQGMRYARTILEGRRVDVVIASSTYPLDILAARRIAALSGAELVFEVHDLWPLSPMELGRLSPSHPFIALMQWAENLAYRSAHKVVSLLPNTIGHMQEHGMKREKFLYIPNGVDCEAWQESQAPIPTEHANTFNILREKGHLIIGYAGSHGLANSLGTLLDAASILRDRPVTFVLVGQGPERTQLMKDAEARGLDNVSFLPSVRRAAIPQLLSQFDAGYLGWRRQPLYRFGISPNKLIDYMMAALPVIHAVEAANDPVADAGCGFSITPEHPSKLADAAIELLELPQSERIVMGNRGRAYVMANQTYEILAQRFLEGLNRVDR